METGAVGSTGWTEEVLGRVHHDRALRLRLVFRLPLRQTEGFLRSVLALMRTDLEAPDHTTLSRRSQHLDLATRSHSGPATCASHRR